MNWREFFTISDRKILSVIVLLVIIFGAQFIITLLFPTYDTPWNAGIPMVFLKSQCENVVSMESHKLCYSSFYLQNFVIDLVIWAVIAFIIASSFKNTIKK